jgi:hypothetical protein
MKNIALFIAGIIISITAACQPLDKSKLIGRWQSKADKKSFLTFTKKYQVSEYEGSDLDTAIYTIKKDKIGDKLVVFDSDGDFEYYILTLTASNLSLSYIPRGNTLTFRRIISRPVRKNKIGKKS